MDKEAKLRVFNRTNYDIGVKLQNGKMPNIAAGTFITMTVDDIQYIDQIARGRKPFSSKELVAVSDDGKDLTLEDIGGYTDPHTLKHLDEREIENNLKKSGNQIKRWLDDIKDPVELDSILHVAEAMDLPVSKMNLVKAKMPGNELIEE